MTFSHTRRYTGPLQAAIFDWAGTVLDYGCVAPANVFIKLFASRGVPVTMAEARGPMGMHKRDHIAAITALASVGQRWAEVHGTPPAASDIDAMFDEFVPMLKAVIAEYAALVPGVVETVAALRKRGLKIGSSTGYNEELMEILRPAAAKQGYEVDALVCASEVAAGRPAPWMALRNAELLGVYPAESIVKIGDTVTDIQEGLNAGMWSVGVVESGNEVGLTWEQRQSCAPSDWRQLCRNARQRLLDAGAHFVIPSLHELPALVDEISARLRQGERP